jgi:transcriptional regulator with XRE-family HTH domain
MKLGTVLRKWRLMSELDLRSAAAEMNLDAATLMRIEQGRMPSGETLRSILRWLMEDSK